MATLRIIAGAYVADWRDKGGRRHRVVVGPVAENTRAKGEELVARLNAEKSPAYDRFKVGRAPLFNEFTAEYLRWHAVEYPASSWRVESALRHQLLPEFQYLRLDDITPRLVDAWKHRRLQQVKSQTVTKELRTLKAMLNKAVEWGDLPKSPIPYVAAPRNLDSKPPRFFTREEMEAIYAACRAEVNAGEGPQPNPLHAHWWRLYANTGLRRTEGLLLRWAWIGREAMKILSTEDERTKSGKWREVPLSPGALTALDALPRSDVHVLPRITLPSLSRAAARDIERAGVIGGSLHTFRHTYCSHLVMAGVDLRTVQVLAGHSTIKVTERYAHLAPGHLASAGGAISL